MWIIIGIVAVVCIAVIAFGAKVSGMNGEPAQQELADRIVELMAKGPDGQEVYFFTIASTRAMAAHGLNKGQVQNRMVHALSLAKPRLTDEGYRVAREVFRAST